ncbi:hypothetical protein OROHE_006836 [Orobanche hederae]
MYSMFLLLHSIRVGIAEMKVAIEKSGGLVILAESFGHSVFKDSFKRIFEDGEQSLGLSFKSVSITTGLLVIENSSVSQEQRGAANGISMTAMSLCNAVGLAAGGSL